MPEVSLFSLLNIGFVAERNVSFISTVPFPLSDTLQLVALMPWLVYGI